jgi:hypothetical protein
VGQPRRWIIDFAQMKLKEAERYPAAIKIVRERVDEGSELNQKAMYRKRWWQSSVLAVERRQIPLVINDGQAADISPVPFDHAGPQVLSHLQGVFLGRQAGDSLGLNEDGHPGVHDADVFPAGSFVAGRFGVGVADVGEAQEPERLDDCLDEDITGAGQQIVKESVWFAFGLDLLFKFTDPLTGGFLRR